MEDDPLAVAFGAHPGESVPVADHTRVVPAVEVWMRAVVLGARGHYARAATQLDRLDGAGCHAALRSLARSTRASHLRQSGQHGAAYRFDGEALRLVALEGSDPVTRAARLDATVGLAADCLGTGQLDLADRLLNRAGRALEEEVADDMWVWTGRPRLRHAWVRTELALYRGDPNAAREAGAVADGLAADCPSTRHRLKTQLISAATVAAGGDVDAAAEAAMMCAEQARAHGQLPLEWAATSLLVGVSAATGVVDVHAVAGTEAVLRAELNRRGGRFGWG